MHANPTTYMRGKSSSVAILAVTVYVQHRTRAVAARVMKFPILLAGLQKESQHVMACDWRFGRMFKAECLRQYTSQTKQLQRNRTGHRPQQSASSRFTDHAPSQDRPGRCAHAYGTDRASLQNSPENAWSRANTTPSVAPQNRPSRRTNTSNTKAASPQHRPSRRAYGCDTGMLH